MAISLMTNAVGNLITLGLTEAFKNVFDADELVRNAIQNIVTNKTSILKSYEYCTMQYILL